LTISRNYGAESAAREDVRLRFENAKGMAGMLISEASPPAGDAIIKSDVGYHIRQGGHSIELSDWQRFIEFAEYHLKK
jgi:hypothetical protein